MLNIQIDPFHVPGRGAAYDLGRQCSDCGGEPARRRMGGTLGKRKLPSFHVDQRSRPPSTRPAGSSSRRRRRKIWRGTLWVWNPCNPLKSHKTAKGIFGNPWTETA